MTRVALVCRLSEGRVDGIRDYTVRLRDELRAEGAVDAWICGRTADGHWRNDPVAQRGGDGGRLRERLGDCDAVVLQYNPFCFGRRGVAPWLPRELAALRRRRGRRPLLALMAHEYAMPLHGLRSSMMGAWQRAQIRAVFAACDLAFAAIEPWTEMLASWRPRRAVHHLPVGSALPDMRHLRAQSRARLGLADDELAVATVGTGHVSQLTAPVRLALNAMAERGLRVRLLRLGAGAGELSGLDARVGVHRPDRQPAEQLAADLAAADLALLPISEGASTRRTSLVSVLQQGIPVVSTDAVHTGATLRSREGLLLAPLGDDDAFVDMALHLATAPPAERAGLGQNARGLHDEVFAWPAITARLLAGLEAAR